MSEQWKPPPAPTWDDLANETFRLRAENARLRASVIELLDQMATVILRARASLRRCGEASKTPNDSKEALSD